MPTDILAQARARAPALAALRRDLHRIPELRFEERETADRIESEIRRIGIPARRAGGGTGILGLIEGRAKGPCVALRADIDGLPVTEETGLPYASRTKGRMHACGHDGHIACLVGAAEILAARRGEFAGSVRLLFQPAEENTAGAKRMIEDGALADPPVSRIFALHGWTFLDAGVIGFKDGSMMASTDTFRIVVRGKGAHGAYPHLSVDPVLVACRIVEALQSVVSRSVDPLEPAVVTVGRISGGETMNVIPPQAEMEGTFRALTPEVRRLIPGRISALARGIAEGAGAAVEISFEPGSPAVLNDPASNALARAAAKRLGLPAEEIARPSMGGEDFAYYLEKVPGAIVRLGIGRDRPGIHAPTFDFNDEALPAGAAFLAAAALESLGAG